jgi:hypothetical protein
MTARGAMSTRPLQQPPEAGVNNPMETFAAQLDLGFHAANETLLGTATAWNAVFRAYIDSADAARRAFGGLLIDWQQQVFPRPDR